jgi:hypothetical protein
VNGGGTEAQMIRIVKLGVGVYRRVEMALDVEIGVWEMTGRLESQSLSFSAAALSKYLVREPSSNGRSHAYEVLTSSKRNCTSRSKGSTLAVVWIVVSHSVAS